MSRFRRFRELEAGIRRCRVPPFPYSILYQDEVRASPAAKPLPGILREQDRPAGIHDNAGVLRTIS
jgi:hypothetical protein